MNRLSVTKFAPLFSGKIPLLIVAAVICCSEFVYAAPKKFTKQPVDNVAAEAHGADVSGEHLIYSKVIDSYRGKHLNELNRAVELMLKAYPRSVHADNAIYLRADLMLEKGQFQNALTAIDSLLENYPTSNKRVSALYLKSQALERTRQLKAAELARDEIQKRYPGSIEAAAIYSQRTLQK